MSRIGKRPIAVPDNVSIQIAGGKAVVKGPKGQLECGIAAGVTVEFQAAEKAVVVRRQSDERQHRANHGLMRALLNNMVVGVVQPFERRLEIQGVGYHASLQGKKISLSVGFSHPVILDIPPSVTCTTPDPTHIVLTSCDKHAVGQFAAHIRGVRPPEPYKGKGIRYQGEYVRRKAGKAFGSK